MESSTEIPTLIKVIQLFALAAYFAGTFHVVRLFIAHREAMARKEPDRTILTKQFQSLEQRALYFLNWPMLLLFICLGLYQLWLRPDLFKHAFMQVLFGYFALLFLYQMVVHGLYRRAVRGELAWSTFQLRVWSSLATLLLFTLVVLLIFREQASWAWGAIGLLVVGGAVILGTGALRKSNPTGDA